MRLRLRLPQNARATAILLLAVALTLASCQRSGSSRTAAAGPAKHPAAPPSVTPAPAPSRPQGGAAPTAPATGAGTGARVERQPPAAPVPATAPAPAVLADTGLTGLLCQGGQDGNLPEDFEIGPLGAARLLGTDERAAYLAAVSLLDAFARGQVDRTGLAAGSREALAGMLAFAIERGSAPAAWRLGPPRAAGSELVANLRLLGADGSAEGELYARHEGGEFRVSDLQVDPARMRVKRDRSGRRFFPSPYRWLLGG